MEALLLHTITSTPKNTPNVSTGRRDSKDGMQRRMSVQLPIFRPPFPDNSEQSSKKKGVRWPVSIVMQQAITDGDLVEIRALIAQHGKKILLEKEPSGLPPVMRAVFEDQLDSLKLLVENGADLTAQDCEGWNVLHVASAMDDLEAAKYILATNTEYSFTQTTNVDNQRPIDLAESIEMASFLLNEDLKEDRSERECVQTEAMATESSIVELVRDSYEKDLSLDYVHKILRSNSEFDSLLHFAAARNHPRVAKFVLDYQVVDKDYRDSRGWTALHTAAYHSSIDVLMVLIQYGASARIMTTALELASELAQHELILEILKNAEES